MSAQAEAGICACCLQRKLKVIHYDRLDGEVGTLEVCETCDGLESWPTQTKVGKEQS